MINEKKLWENYAELGKMVVESKLSRENFGKQIYAFSTFLSEMNHDYHYNGTYLPHYADEFLDFLKCFFRKYSFVKTLFSLASHYVDVCLIIDRYWQQDCIWNSEKEEIDVKWTTCSSYEKRLVYNDKLLIECSVLCETKRFIYQSKLEMNEQMESREVEKFRKFLDDKASLNNVAK